MAEVVLRVVRQTEAQAAELRVLLDSPNLSAWDRGRLRALGQLAPEREHQAVLHKLAALADRDAKAKAKKAAAKQGDDDGFKSLLGLG
jgi:hypothetical protein